MYSQTNSLSSLTAKKPGAIEWAKSDAEFQLKNLGKDLSKKIYFEIVDERKKGGDKNESIYAYFDDVWPHLINENLNNKGVFFSVNDFKLESQEKKDIEKINAIVVEGHINSVFFAEFFPSMLIENGSEHCAYFKIAKEDSKKIQELELLSLMISSKLGGYRNTYSCNHLTRLMGTVSWKKRYPTYTKDIMGDPHPGFSIQFLKNRFQLN